MFRKDRKKVEGHTMQNESEILASDVCGCLGCMTTFKPEEISEWTGGDVPDDPSKRIDRSAVCPHCGDPLLIGDRSGYEITDTFLETMRVR